MKPFLAVSKYIDWDHPEIKKMAGRLADGTDLLQTAKNCFEFVRDHILHSKDFSMNPVTCKASDVLKYKTGYCYAKSHLLNALLRANHIPAGLCYQRLTISNNKPPYCLHGLSAVYLETYGWYRIDPRGNKTDVDAQFCPPKEQLAFQIISNGEADLPGIWPEPLPQVVAVLETSSTYEAVAHNLPDLESLSD